MLWNGPPGVTVWFHLVTVNEGGSVVAMPPVIDKPRAVPGLPYEDVIPAVTAVGHASLLVELNVKLSLNHFDIPNSILEIVEVNT